MHRNNQNIEVNQIQNLAANFMSALIKHALPMSFPSNSIQAVATPTIATPTSMNSNTISTPNSMPEEFKQNGTKTNYALYTHNLYLLGLVQEYEANINTLQKNYSDEVQKNKNQKLEAEVKRIEASILISTQEKMIDELKAEVQNNIEINSIQSTTIDGYIKTTESQRKQIDEVTSKCSDLQNAVNVSTTFINEVMLKMNSSIHGMEEKFKKLEHENDPKGRRAEAMERKRKREEREGGTLKDAIRKADLMQRSLWISAHFNPVNIQTNNSDNSNLGNNAANITSNNSPRSLQN